MSENVSFSKQLFTTATIVFVGSEANNEITNPMVNPVDYLPFSNLQSLNKISTGRQDVFMLSGTDLSGNYAQGDIIGTPNKFFMDSNQQYPGYFGGVGASLEDDGGRGHKLNRSLSFQVATVPGKPLKAIVISFDRIDRAFASYVIIKKSDGTQIAAVANYDAVFEYYFLEPQENPIFEITHLNRPTNLRITSNTNNLTKQFNFNLRKVKASRQNIKDNTQIEYGVLGQFGNIEINDKNNELSAFGQNNLLQDNLQCRIDLWENVAFEDGKWQATKLETWGEYLTQQWNFNNERIVSVDLIDESFAWSGEKGITDIGMQLQENKNIDFIFRTIFTQSLNWTYGVEWRYRNYKTMNIAQNTYIPFTFLDSEKLKEQLDKPCNVGQFIIKKVYDNDLQLSVFEVALNRQREGT